MNISFSKAREPQALKDMLNLRIKATSVFGHPSSRQLSKEDMTTGIEEHNHLIDNPIFAASKK